MRIKDKGTLPQSRMYFTMANEFAKKALYHLIYSGTFYCTDKYKVSRDNFNSYLFMYIKKGKMKINYRNHEFVASEGNFVFLNCFEPHIYEAEEEENVFDWFHFAGNSSNEYFDLLYEKHGCVYALNNHYIVPEYMNRILKMAKNNEGDEHDVSIYIQRILYELVQLSTITDTSTKKIEQAILFMENHYHENIKLEDIANHVYLSPYYFSRTFKKHMDSTPVEYLINYRINNAKKVLHNTDLSINEIAHSCGFNSTSHFITTFKKHVGMSPKKFRDILF